jgi:hypothetical protein
MPASAWARFGEGADRLRTFIADLIEAMGRDDAETLAASAIAEMVGAIALARATGDAVRSDEILAATRSAVRERPGSQSAALTFCTAACICTLSEAPCSVIGRTPARLRFVLSPRFPFSRGSPKPAALRAPFRLRAAPHT